MIKTKRWFLGVQSRKDAAVIMIEVCRTIQLLGYEWFLENEYQIRCRQVFHANHVDHMTEMRLQLYKVQEHAYLLDFQKLDGNVCSFMHMCGTVIDQLQKGLSRNAQLMCTRICHPLTISSCYHEGWLMYNTTLVCFATGELFPFDGVSSLRLAPLIIPMFLPLLSLLLLSLCHSAIVERVWVRPASTIGQDTPLSSTTLQSISVSSLQQALDIGVQFCPPSSNARFSSHQNIISRFTIKFTVKGINHESVHFMHHLQSSSTECLPISSAVFSDGESFWYATQGVYSIIISIHDSSPYAIFSTSYSLAVIRPASIQFQLSSPLSASCTLPLSSLANTPFTLLLPSSVTPTTVRWILDGREAASTTHTWPLSLLLTSRHSFHPSLTEGTHSLVVLLHTEPYGFPEYAQALSFTATSTQAPTKAPTKAPTQPPVTPTIPPHVAPTVPPKAEESRSYCGDGDCSADESCASCPLDCGLCSSYTCSPQHCASPACRCAATTHPLGSAAATPQFVTITWDDAQTPTTFSAMMDVARTTSVGLTWAFHRRHVTRSGVVRR